MADLTIRHDVFVHHQNEDKLDEILRRLRAMQSKEDIMSQAIDSLTAAVEQAKTVEAGAITLIQGIHSKLTDLAAELAAAGVDTAKVDALASDLKASSDALAAAVVANTDAAPPAPAPTDGQPSPQ